MAKPGREARKHRGKAPKEAVVAFVATLLGKGHGFLLCNNKGLSLAEATALRAKLRENKVVLKVVKNTLLKRALEKQGIDPAQFGTLLTRETVLAIGLDDPVTPAKILVEYAGKNEKLEIKGGYLDEKVLTAADVDSLSRIPGREELLQRFLGSLQSPPQNFVYALNATVSNVVYALDAIRRKKEEEAA